MLLSGAVTQTSDKPSSVYRQGLIVPEEAIDGLGHVSNVHYVRWVQDVAQAHSEAAGYGVEEYMSLGLVFVVRRHELDYLRPSFAGEELELVTWVEKWTAATSFRRTQIRRGEHRIVEGLTTWALVSASTGRPSRIPKEMRAAFLVGSDNGESKG